MRLVMTCVMASLACAVFSSWARAESGSGSRRIWPCRLIVEPPLRDVVEDAWKRSATLRRQCRELADAGAVVVLEWGTFDSQTQASTRLGIGAHGRVIASVSVPPVGDAIELVAHELEHVIEMTQGVDLPTESRRRGSGVWKAFSGFESQRAIDTGRQVAKELEDSRRSR